MDIHDLVTAAVNTTARQTDIMRELHGWYLFGDKRPGTPVERFEFDAKNFSELSRLYKRKPHA